LLLCLVMKSMYACGPVDLQKCFAHALLSVPESQDQGCRRSVDGLSAVKPELIMVAEAILACTNDSILDCVDVKCNQMIAVKKPMHYAHNMLALKLCKLELRHWSKFGHNAQ